MASTGQQAGSDDVVVQLKWFSTLDMKWVMGSEVRELTAKLIAVCNRDDE